jgi:C-methyltransferase C-terminal domain/Putative zinc binding domain
MPHCRACQAHLHYTWVDLGHAPIVNAPLLSRSASDLSYPLKVMVCQQCWLVQSVRPHTPLPHYTNHSASNGIIPHYNSGSAATLVQRAIQRLNLNDTSLVLDIAVNDEDILQHFHAHDIPVLGLNNTEHGAIKAPIPLSSIRRLKWSLATAEALGRESISPDLIVASHVLPFVENLHETIEACAYLMPEHGWAVVEFPHVVSLMDYGQFDAITHEHISYLSLTSLMPLFLRYRLIVADAETLPLQGGSLRVWLRHAEAAPLDDICAMRVAGILAHEWSTPLDDIAGYQGFQQRIDRSIQELRLFLSTARTQGKRIVGIGATAKGNTLLNAAKITDEDVEYIVDRIPSRQGGWLPGCRIPVKHPDYLLEDKPDYLLILSWQQKNEIWEEWRTLFQQWGGQAIVAIPTLEVLR